MKRTLLLLPILLTLSGLDGLAFRVILPGPLDYFPLQTGNEWVYEVTRNGNSAQPDRKVTCEVTRDNPGATIAKLDNTYWGDLSVYQLKQDFNLSYAKGMVYASVGGQAPGLFTYPAILAREHRSDFESECPDRPKQMRIQLVDEHITVPAGTFSRCCRIIFECPILADYNVEYVFAPEVGLIRYQITGLNGIIVKEELLRATVNGVRYEDFEENGLDVRLVSNRFFFLPDNPNVNISPEATTNLRAKFEIKNNDPIDILLAYPTTCQNPVFSIVGDDGTVYWKSESRISPFCREEATEAILASGESLRFDVNIDLLMIGELPNGAYQLQATTRSTPELTASIPFVLAPPIPPPPVLPGQ